MDEKGRRCAIHDLALSPDGACLVCRRASAAPRAGPTPSLRSVQGRSFGWLTFALLLGGGLVAVKATLNWIDSSSVEKTASGSPETDQATATGRQPGAVGGQAAASSGLAGKLTTKNRSERSGAYFIPDGSSLPLLVALHGSGGDGAGILGAFRQLAEARRFAIVAPDSGFIAEAGLFTWYVAQKRGDSSADSEHIAACIDEVVALAAGRIAPSGWLAVGHSGGASSAPYLATHDARFAAFGVLHGGAFPDAFGPLRPRGWFSTGSGDPMRPPAHVLEMSQSSARVLGAARVQNHVYPGGHELSIAEITETIGFWFGTAPL
jgi:poly(3-hydroxybutyrate) depolymerase